MSKTSKLLTEITAKMKELKKIKAEELNIKILKELSKNLLI